MCQITEAVHALANGRPVIVLSGGGSSARGELVFAAETATPKLVAFAVRHTSGFLGVALAAIDCDRLDLPLQSAADPDQHRPGYAVTVDARAGISTGISAADRSRTMRLLADPDCAPGDLSRPGHVVPIRVGPAGVRGRANSPAAGLDLVQIAGLRPAATMSTLTSTAPYGDIATEGDLRLFADRHDLPIVTIADVERWRRDRDPRIERVSDRLVETTHGTRRTVSFVDQTTFVEHVAILHGNVRAADTVVRIHVSCVDSELVDADGCECAARLASDLSAVSHAVAGVLVYLRRPVGEHQRINADSFVLVEQVLHELGLERPVASLPVT